MPEFIWEGKIKRGTIELYYVTISLTQNPTYY